MQLINRIVSTVIVFLYVAGTDQSNEFHAGVSRKVLGIAILDWSLQRAVNLPHHDEETNLDLSYSVVQHELRWVLHLEVLGKPPSICKVGNDSVGR